MTTTHYMMASRAVIAAAYNETVHLPWRVTRYTVPDLFAIPGACVYAERVRGGLWRVTAANEYDAWLARDFLADVQRHARAEQRIRQRDEQETARHLREFFHRVPPTICEIIGTHVYAPLDDACIHCQTPMPSRAHA